MNKVEEIPEKIVVVGGSHGAIEALLEIVPNLPADLTAAIFVVVHIPVDADSYLPDTLRRSGPLRVHHAIDGSTSMWLVPTTTLR
jgi:two-component system, chemotaxis family, protein-glutamate methylesterase/glutaminase